MKPKIQLRALQLHLSPQRNHRIYTRNMFGHLIPPSQHLYYVAYNYAWRGTIVVGSIRSTFRFCFYFLLFISSYGACELPLLLPFFLSSVQRIHHNSHMLAAVAVKGRTEQQQRPHNSGTCCVAMRARCARCVIIVNIGGACKGSRARAQTAAVAGQNYNRLSAWPQHIE